VLGWRRLKNPHLNQKGSAMPATAKPGTLYKGRRPDKVVRVLTIDREADNIMRQYCPTGTRQLGAFVSKLLYEFRTREEERQKLVRKIMEV
jgi:hypothetical protein